MFDVGFWELTIIAIVALLVVGPEKLPELVRDAGKWLGAIRRYVRNTKREIELELQLDSQKDLSEKITDLDDLMKFAPDKHENSQKKNQQDV